MIETITLSGVLPDVFHNSRDERFILDSQVWLKEVTFTRQSNYLIKAMSGAGKSSLCAFIYGLRSDYSGRIMIDGENIKSFSAERLSELRCRSLAYLPQEMKLFPELTALENIRVKNRLTGFRNRNEIIRMLDELGIADKVDVPAARLSVGQQQRVAIVRTLCQPFGFVIIDEPVSHLDELNNSVVAAMIQREASAQGASIIATSVGNNIKIDNYKELHL